MDYSGYAGMLVAHEVRKQGKKARASDQFIVEYIQALRANLEALEARVRHLEACVLPPK